MTNNLKAIDAPSIGNKFGWENVGRENFAVPVIFRSNDVKYCPVRIVEQEIIKKYDLLPQSVFQCLTLKSYYITPAEAKLLNTINFHHSNARYGEQFFTSKDVIISFEDVRYLSRFLNMTNQLYNDLDSDAPLKFIGVVKLRVDQNDESQTILIPYVTKKIRGDNQVKFVPLKMVEPFLAPTATTVKGSLNDWDLMYLKMLNNYCQNNVEITKEAHSRIILLDGLVYKKNNAPITYETFRMPKPN